GGSRSAYALRAGKPTRCAPRGFRLWSDSLMAIRCDYVVVGGGIAGLTFALEAAREAEVVVVTKRLVYDAATAYAQGGIAAVLDPEDSFESHALDTLEAGRGLSHNDVVEMVVRDGPDRIRDLIQLGAAFTPAE